MFLNVQQANFNFKENGNNRNIMYIHIKTINTTCVKCSSH